MTVVISHLGVWWHPSQLTTGQMLEPELPESCSFELIAPTARRSSLRYLPNTRTTAWRKGICDLLQGMQLKCDLAKECLVTSKSLHRRFLQPRRAKQYILLDRCEHIHP